MSDIIRNMDSFYIDVGQGKSIPAEELLPERAVVFADDPVPDKTIEDMRHNIERISSVQELVDIYANVHIKNLLIFMLMYITSFGLLKMKSMITKKALMSMRKYVLKWTPGEI